MAGSKYAYVRNFEIPDPLLPNTFMVLRVDGHAFHRFSETHKFAKPNDKRALELMDKAAMKVMKEYKDIVLAFGESDEYSFLLRRSTALYNRRHAKLLSTLTSYFTSSYIYHWRDHFPDTPLAYPPCFDGRIVLYPTAKEVRDYFSWRQADTHINNLYNTVFWALVQQGNESTTQAHSTLRGTVSSQKHDILFNRFSINYNEISVQFRKGSVIVREESPRDVEPVGQLPLPPDAIEAVAGKKIDIVQYGTSIPGDSTKKVSSKGAKPRIRTQLIVLHCDIIGDEFWERRPLLLE